MTDTQVIKEHPLSWPNGLDRSTAQVPSKFKTSLAGALKNVRASLNGFARDTQAAGMIASVVISTNATLTTVKPRDAGVAVWFFFDGAWRCFAVDRYRSVAENLQAIHHVIEADRTKIRHAGVTFFKATFRTSTDTLMITGPKVDDWRDILGAYPGGFGVTPISRADINAAYRKHAKLAGQDEARLRVLNAAKEAAFAEVPAR